MAHCPFLKIFQQSLFSILQTKLGSQVEALDFHKLPLDDDNTKCLFMFFEKKYTLFSEYTFTLMSFFTQLRLHQKRLRLVFSNAVRREQ